MFKITENRISQDFSCRYEDGYGNKVRFQRNSGNGMGFYARVNFADKDVTMPVIKVSFPVQTGDKGLKVNLNFKDGKDHSADEDVKAAMEGVTELINRWIMMLTDVIALNLPFDKARPMEEQAKERFKVLDRYEEMNGITSAAGRYRRK